MPVHAVPPPDDARAFLRSTELFGRLDDAALDEVVEALEWVHLDGGEMLFRQGDHGDALYLVVSGRLRVSGAREDGSEWVIREAGHGENVGELALLTEEPRSATVRAVRDSDLARLSRRRFEQLLLQHPAAVMQLLRMLASWVRRGNLPQSRGRIVTITVLALEPGAPIEPFVANLAEVLREEGPTLVVDAQAVDRALFPGAADLADDDPRHGLVTAWLDEREAGCALRRLPRVGRAARVVAALSPSSRSHPAAGARRRRLARHRGHGGDHPRDPRSRRGARGPGAAARARRGIAARHLRLARAPSGDRAPPPAHRRAARPRAPGAPPCRQVDRARAERRRRARLRAHRRDPGARGGRHPDRPPRRHQHGRGHRRAVRVRPRPARDARDEPPLAGAQPALGPHPAGDRAGVRARRAAHPRHDVRRPPHRGPVARATSAARPT